MMHTDPLWFPPFLFIDMGTSDQGGCGWMIEALPGQEKEKE